MKGVLLRSESKLKTIQEYEKEQEQENEKEKEKEKEKGQQHVQEDEREHGQQQPTPPPQQQPQQQQPPQEQEKEKEKEICNDNYWKKNDKTKSDIRQIIISQNQEGLDNGMITKIREHTRSIKTKHHMTQEFFLKSIDSEMIIPLHSPESESSDNSEKSSSLNTPMRKRNDSDKQLMRAEIKKFETVTCNKQFSTFAKMNKTISPTKLHTVIAPSSGYNQPLGTRTFKQMVENDLNYEMVKEVSFSEKNNQYWKHLKIIRKMNLLLLVLIASNIIICAFQNWVFLRGTINEIKVYGVQSNEAWDWIQRRKETILEIFLLVFNMLISIISSVLFIVIHYKKFRLLVDEHKYTKSSFFVFEIPGIITVFNAFVLIISLPPGASGLIVNKNELKMRITIYSYNGIFCSWTLWKIIQIFLTVSEVSSFSSNISRAIAQKYNILPTLIFVTKSNVIKYNWYYITFAFLYNLGFCAIIIHNIEFAIYEKGVWVSNIQLFTNCVWLIFCMSTSVINHDVYPISSLGYLICFFARVFGLLLLSLLVIKISSLFYLSFEESKSYSKLKLMHSRENNQFKAREVIGDLINLRKVGLMLRKSRWRSKINKTFYLKSQFIILCYWKVNMKYLRNPYVVSKVANRNGMGIPDSKWLEDLTTRYESNYVREKQLLSKIHSINSNLKQWIVKQHEVKDTLTSVHKLEKRWEEYFIELNNSRIKTKVNTRNNQINTRSNYVNSTPNLRGRSLKVYNDIMKLPR